MAAAYGGGGCGLTYLSMGGLQGNTEDSKEMQNAYWRRVVEVQFGGWLSAM